LGFTLIKHGLFERNELRENRGSGVSIGHKDSDNQFRGNTISGNGKAGVLFRHESEAMGAHRNLFEENTILDNGTGETSERSWPCVDIRGAHHDLIFRGNTIGHSRPSPGAGPGIRHTSEAKGLQAEENEFRHVKQKVEVAD
jgi:parallel beta-helix repeat protein